MKNLLAFICFIVLINIAGKATAGTINPKPGELNEGTNDTNTSIKSNIVIFKIIATPPVSNESKPGGSLKKAGKVAKTSYSHSTIENIIFKKGGI